MIIERGPLYCIRLSFNISFIMLLGILVSACRNRISNNDVVNQPQTDFEKHAVFDPDSVDRSGYLGVEPLITALEADGYNRDEIIDALEEITSALDDNSDISVSCLQFLDLMMVLQSSQENHEQIKEIHDTNSGLIEKSLCGDLLSPTGYDPEMELSSKYLICPSIPATNPIIPPGPYDEEIGDCALRGKSTEINTWLTNLEQIAATCQADRDTNWAITMALGDAYNDWIEDLANELEETGTSIISLSAEEINTHCPPYIVHEILEPDEEYGSPSFYYTRWLIRIGLDVSKYCTMINELVKPLWLACDQINSEVDCKTTDPESYHSILELRMNEALTKYNNIDTFYTTNLMDGGWNGFSIAFSETSIDCPLDPQTPNTKFTFDMNTFCRRGPSSLYEKVATFLEGQEVQIEGRNHHEPRWWVVPDPGKTGNCWVSDSTGSAEGPLDELEIVAPPPLVINSPKDNQSQTTCSKDLGPSACAAAGGTMAGGATGAPYCDCP